MFMSWLAFAIVGSVILLLVMVVIVRSNAYPQTLIILAVLTAIASMIGGLNKLDNVTDPDRIAGAIFVGSGVVGLAMSSIGAAIMNMRRHNSP